MARNKAFRVLVLVLSLAILFTVIVPPLPAQAQSITLSPTSGFLGIKVTVTGTGFSSEESTYVYLYFDTAQIKSIKVSETGTFTADFIVPLNVTPGKSYEVTVKDEDGIALVEEWFIVGAKIDLYPDEGKIDGRIELGGRCFDADREVAFYFSSDTANIGDNIDHEVTAYEYIGKVETDADGGFETRLSFSVPGELTDGEDKESVRSGDYYIYATHLPGEKRIKAAARFSVLGGEIEIQPAAGNQGDEITVTGTGFYSGGDAYVYLYFGNSRIKRVEIAESGTFITDFAVPYFIRPGISYTVSVKDEGSVTLASAEKQFKVGAKIDLYSNESYSNRTKVDDWIKIGGRYFNANKQVGLYFSSDKANIDDSIDRSVTAYEYIGAVGTNASGDFEALINFSIPGELTDGEDDEDVRSGDYYIYVFYLTGVKRVEAAAKFVVLGITLNPIQGTVNSELAISGEELGDGQKITVEYDEDEVEIVGGDDETDSEGRFTCSIIIPESVIGDHVIAVSDQSGNKYEAVFTVKPEIIIAPTSVTEGDEVKVSGTGFEAPYYSSDYITITLDGDMIQTRPALIQTSLHGSFSGSFIVPFGSSPTGNVTMKVEAYDYSFDMAEAQLTVSTIPATQADITLYPATSQTSPGYAGMELTAEGTGFTANATVSLTYGNGETAIIATRTADADGNFSATFTVPPSIAGEHTITATDVIKNAASTFTMESEAPRVPMLLPSNVIATEDMEAHLDWEDVTDPSGVSYTLQIASDIDFDTIVLEKTGLINSEYPITIEDGLESTDKENPYYWRVKAIDGAFNESEWTQSGLLYVGFPQISGPGSNDSVRDVSRWSAGMWALMVFIGIGIVGLILMVAGLRR